MTSTIVRSKTVTLFIVWQYVFKLTLYVGVCVCSLFSDEVLSIIPSCLIILPKKRDLVSLFLFVLAVDWLYVFCASSLW